MKGRMRSQGFANFCTYQTITQILTLGKVQINFVVPQLLCTFATIDERHLALPSFI